MSYLLRLYPAAWRKRYGQELETLTRDCAFLRPQSRRLSFGFQPSHELHRVHRLCSSP